MHQSTMSSAGKGILLLAIVGLLHAAYSAYERRPLDLLFISIISLAVDLSLL
ncbi:hypothetical protein RSAG8_06137, partial [Rhizoctonia solani AG-8 WAC10335]